MQPTADGQGHLCRKLGYMDCAGGASYSLQPAKDHVGSMTPNHSPGFVRKSVLIPVLVFIR
eukprot:scaffold417029_cov17-Prasinocladus_malaysianus.AAC.1